MTEQTTTDAGGTPRAQEFTVTFDRPERLNAFDGPMARAAVKAIEDCSVDSGVIVITGQGRGFCAGGYLATMDNPDPREVRAMYEGSLALLDAIRTSPRPVVSGEDVTAGRPALTTPSSTVTA